MTNNSHRYDEEHTCFILTNTDDCGNSRDTHVAFCIRFFAAPVEAEQGVFPYVHAMLCEMTRGAGLDGFTLRVGMSANQNIGWAVPGQTRLQGSRDNALVAAMQREADSQFIQQAYRGENGGDRPTNYDYFISGFVPLDDRASFSVALQKLDKVDPEIETAV